MDQYAPSYYQKFKCIASACRHSCCIGWEIDIDDKTLRRYRKTKGDFGKRLCESIDRQGGAHFRLGEGERCPFLNQAGLCDIIIHMGEEALSQICTDHPRFRHFLSDHTEIGLGICCEEACRLLLAEKEKISLCAVDTVEEEAYAPDAFEKERLAFRETLFSIAQDRTLPIALRLEKIFRVCEKEMPTQSIAEWVDVLLSLERMDAAWTELLKASRNASRDAWEPTDAIPQEQLLWYFLFRHVADAEDREDLCARGAFCALSVWLIAHIAASKKESFAEVCRLYSAEIEYSEENTQALIERMRLL